MERGTTYTIHSVLSIGIGTDAPDRALHVNGSVRINDGYSLSMGAGAEQRILAGGTSSSTYLTFSQWTGASFSERMRIDSSGNVGIGISPSKKLTVFGTGSGNATVQIEGEGGADPYINFLANNTQHWSLGVDDSDSDKFKLSEHSALGTNDYLVVDTSGKVGIGTTSTTGKLTVSSGTAGGGYNSDYDELVLTNSGRSGINILSGATDFSAIIMGGKADNSTGGIFHNASTNMLSFSTQDAFRLNIDSSGNVGIGTLLPSTTLDVKGTISLQATNSTNKWLAYTYTDNTLRLNYNGAGNDEVLINSSGQVGIGVSPLAKLHVNDTTYPSLRLSTATSYSNIYHDGTTGSITYSADDGNAIAGSSHQFYVDGSSAMTIDSSGNVNITTGNLILDSGAGIDFSDTPDGSGTMTSELLDDYEEGTWTIGVSFSGAAVGVTTTSNTGKYTKIGRQVTLTGYLVLTSKGSSTGNATITGLPFTIGNNNANYSAPSLWFYNITFANILFANGTINSTSIALQESTEAGVNSNITDADFANNTEVVLSFTYFV
jgi:hypothetical protein